MYKQRMVSGITSKDSKKDIEKLSDRSYFAAFLGGGGKYIWDCDTSGDA